MEETHRVKTTSILIVLLRTITRSFHHQWMRVQPSLITSRQSTIKLVQGTLPQRNKTITVFGVSISKTQIGHYIAA